MSSSFIGRMAGGAGWVAGFGIVFAGAGVVLLTVALPRARMRAEAALSVPIVSGVAMERPAVGSRVFIEARISAASPLGFRDFVAFRRREFQGWKEEGGRRRERWETKEVVAPAFVLELASGGHIDVVNGGYGIEEAPRVWRSSETLESSVLGGHTEEVTGFGHGDFVTVDGVWESVSRVRATVVYGGDAAAYRTSLAESVLALQIVGWVFGCVGATLALGGLVAGLSKRGGFAA